MRIMTFAAALLLATPALAAPDVPADRLRAAITADTARNEALLQRLVEQNSGTLNLLGVKAVGDLMRAELEPLGFEVRWIDMAATARAGHLIATHAGPRQRKRVLLIGHLDTVFEPTSAFTGFTRAGTRATGPGVGDDKGGLAVIVGALRAMQAAGTLRQANITVVLTGDEERPGQPTVAARADLVAAGKASDVALEYENLATEGGVDYGTVARRSGSAWELRTQGRSGHSSGVFGASLGYGAIYEMARILDGFRAKLIEPNATFNVGLVAGGTPASIDAGGTTVAATGKTNIVAGDAIARGDLRTLTPAQDEKLRAAMEAIVAAHLPGTNATLTFYDSTPAMAPSDGNRALLATMNSVNRELGLPAMPEFDPAKRGAADSGFVSADVPTLGGLGVAGGGAHAEGEWADLASLPRQALRSAALITQLTREPRPPRKVGSARGT